MFKRKRRGVQYSHHESIAHSYLSHFSNLSHPSYSEDNLRESLDK